MIIQEYTVVTSMRMNRIILRDQTQTVNIPSETPIADLVVTEDWETIRQIDEEICKLKKLTVDILFHRNELTNLEKLFD